MWSVEAGFENQSKQRDKLVLLTIVIAHILAVIALLLLRGPSVTRLLDRAEALTLIPLSEPAPRPRTVPTIRREGRSAPAAMAARESADLSRAVAIAPTLPATLGPGGPAQVGYAAGAGRGVGTGGAGTGGGARADSGALPGIAPPLGITSAPHWVHQITNDELRPLLTGKLRRHGVAVDLLLSCEVMISTRVRNCHVLSEVPADTGIGGEVDTASRYFRIEPSRRAGVPTDGERIEVLWKVDIRPVRRIPMDPPPGYQP